MKPRKMQPIVLKGHKVVLYALVRKNTGQVVLAYLTRREARFGVKCFAGVRIVRGIFQPQGRA